MSLSDVVACMKVEAEDVENTNTASLVSFKEHLYVDGSKKKCHDKGRLHGCTTAKDRISKILPNVAGKRSSIYRGVTRHRWTGRYEAHLWDKTAWNHNQNKKGKQVYLGAYDDEEAAARTYDLAALKYWGSRTLINFPVSDYSRDLEEMQMASKEDYLLGLRRKNNASSKVSPKCRRNPRHLKSSRSQGTASSSVENKYIGNVISMDGKVDLTSYISWWSSKRHQPESITKAHHPIFESLKQYQPTEPYQLPNLEASHVSEHLAVSAFTILSHSDAFTNFLQKFSERTEYYDGNHSLVPTEEEPSILNPDVFLTTLDFNYEE